MLKKKPGAKKCSKACRNYTAPAPMQIHEVQPYTDADIRDIEMEMLGVYLSSTPFDRLNEEHREYYKQSAERQMADDLPVGSRFEVACIVHSKRAHTAKNNTRMGFAELETETNMIDVVVFSTPWTKYSKMMQPGTLGVAEVFKTKSGWALHEFTPIP
jgi:DNA polymerase-3 subunit alpha